MATYGATKRRTQMDLVTVGQAGETLSDHRDSACASLSAREREVLALAAEGYRYYEIAAALFVSCNTARTQLKNILVKTNARNMAHAVAMFVREGG